MVFYHINLERDAQNPMNRQVQRGSTAFLKTHGTQVWKPVQQAWKPALHGFAGFWLIAYEISGLKSGKIGSYFREYGRDGAYPTPLRGWLMRSLRSGGCAALATG
jgi:hypothetical protein